VAWSLAFFAAGSAPAQQYDLLLKGAHVIDPRNSVNAVMDVAIREIASLL
jgi:dihydroorotase